MQPRLHGTVHGCAAEGAGAGAGPARPPARLAGKQRRSRSLRRGLRGIRGLHLRLELAHLGELRGNLFKTETR